MKPDITKHLSQFDIAMIGNLYPLTESKVYDILMDKGDIEFPNANVPFNGCFDDDYELPKGKSMKAANRRKKTFHKHEQREKKYKSLGYHVERLSDSERGKLREGVGAFPEGQHMCSMYNRNGCEGGMRGNRKEVKHFSAKKAFELAEHDKWVDDKSAELEYELYELYNCISSCVEDERMYGGMLNEVMIEINEIMSRLINLQRLEAHYRAIIERNNTSKELLGKLVEEVEKKLDELRKTH